MEYTRATETQITSALKGTVTREMLRVAERERVTPSSCATKSRVAG